MLRASLAALSLSLAAPALAAPPRVVTDIGPTQSITARVMQGLGEPGVILPPGASPHGYSLRPSEARRLAEADLVVWTGPDLTPWLADPIAALAPEARLLTLEDAPGVTTLPVRVDGPFEPEAEEAHGDDNDHADHDHAPGAHDGHLWLDPENAVASARAIAATLGALDPADAATYTANAEAFAAETADLSARISAELAPVRGRPYLVFHDAYQYFERSFDIPAAGSVALQDGVAPGTARVAALRDRVRDEGIVCAFAEPEFEPKLLATVIEGSLARTGVIDNLGTTLTPGPTLYPALLQQVADSLVSCLGE